MPAAPLNTEGQPLIFAKEEAGSFCGIQIPVRETTETTTCCEIPLAPSPLMPQTNLPHILRTVCVSEHAELRVQLHQYMHICFSVCDPACFLGGPGAWGTCRIAFPVEEGAGAAVQEACR